MSTDYAKEFETARARIYHLLKGGAWCSWKELRRVGGVRYSARILELKREGYKIESEMMVSGEHGKRYRMPSPKRGRRKSKRVKVYLNESDAQAISEGTLTRTGIKAVRDALGSFRHNKEKL